MSSKEYYLKNKEKISQKAKEKYQEQREQRLEKQRKHSIENVDQIKQYRQSPKGRFSMIKSGAKRRGLEFELTFDQYVTDFYGRECYFCGELNCTGIDRVDPNFGYIKENMQSCCFNCNEMKMDRNIIEFKDHIIKLYNKIINGKF